MELTDGFDLIDPSTYQKQGAPHEAWTRLRRESPVHRCEPAGYEPFWAITRHADVCEISKQPDKFEYSRSIFVVGPKRLPIRYRIRGR